MNFIENHSYFISDADVVMREDPKVESPAKNHLIFGDWLKYLGQETDNWIKVYSRNSMGWLLKTSVTDRRALEINFVDIGQGDGCHMVTPEDEIILIDAGIGDNMFRFLSWRYNLRTRKVAGIDGVAHNDAEARLPIDIDHVVISHPDQDHYYGFKYLFDCKKVKIKNIYYNGIVERPLTAENHDHDLRYYANDDLGGYVKGTNENYYLWNLVRTNAEMRELIHKYSSSRKKYLSTLRAGAENNPDVTFTWLSANIPYFSRFDQNDPISIKILGPVTEEINKGNSTQPCLLRLGDEGVTKNGHSIILRLLIGNLKILLGGDLNTEAEDYLFQHYCPTTHEVSALEAAIGNLKALGDTISDEQRKTLIDKELILNEIVMRARKHFQVDIAKACHHGSHHFNESFLKSLNALVAVISSGDNESYAHPRPDALGAFGKHGRGERPLIFSTELARSTNEFTEVFKFFKLLKSYEYRIDNAETEEEKRRLENEMQERKDRNVAVYGMITLRTDGDKVIIAQKLEVKKGNDQKWDIHELRFNAHRNEFEYHKK